MRHRVPRVREPVWWVPRPGLEPRTRTKYKIESKLKAAAPAAPLIQEGNSMNYKTRVLKRHPGAKLVKTSGEQDSYSVSEGDTILCASAKSPTDAWRRAALSIDYPYSDADSRWEGGTHKT